jgi:hypothetical protein
MEKENQAALIKTGAIWSTIGVSEGLNSVGINGWGDFAAMLAAVYSIILIVEWVYKKLK